MATTVDALNIANWQRTGDQNAAQPKPITRPSGVVEQDEKRQRNLDRARRFRERQQARENGDADG